MNAIMMELLFPFQNHLLELENDLDSEIEGKYFTATSHHELSGLSVCMYTCN
jgi:hypothetical protein